VKLPCRFVFVMQRVQHSSIHFNRFVGLTREEEERKKKMGRTAARLKKRLGFYLVPLISALLVCNHHLFIGKKVCYF
jgi:hypothetical protein